MKNSLKDHERAVWILKTRGPQPVSAIAKEMEITTEGARFHLLKLAKGGLVQATTKAKGRGRPKQIWSLTEKGHARFPDTHADLTVNLITIMRETLGEESVQEVIKVHGKRTLSRYAEELKECGDLESRIAKLADIRSSEGYMAEYEKDGEGYLLIENHCPICAAATVCQNLCRAEMHTFKAVLGDEVQIERTQHIVSGARRCAYRITPV